MFQGQRILSPLLLADTPIEIYKVADQHPCESSFHGMISSFHGMIPSFYGMIPSFHAVFGLRQRDKSAKVIDYKGQVIRAAGGGLLLVLMVIVGLRGDTIITI